VFPDWSEEKLGISNKLVIKAIGSAYGIRPSDIMSKFSELGDLGEVTFDLCKNKNQQTLFFDKLDLTIQKVFENLQSISKIEGNNSQDLKNSKITQLLTSAKPIEAKFIIRTLLQELRIGVSIGTIRDAIIKSIFPKIIGIRDKDVSKEVEGRVLEINSKEEMLNHNLNDYDFIRFPSYEIARQGHNMISDLIQEAYDKINEMAIVAEIAKEKGLKGISEVKLQVMVPIRAMLMQRVSSIKEATEKINLPFAIEYKYDGFRCQAHKNKDEIKLFTRNLENVTNQFPDVVEYLKQISCESFILDGEIIGIDKDGKYLPFQNISQRIKRKHNIQELIKTIPVIYTSWDVLFYKGISIIDKNLRERREILTKIIEENEKIKISKQKIINDEKLGELFYKESLLNGNEGAVIKDLDSQYKPGNRVGCWLKLKPIMDPLDLVIISAQIGEGKRSKWLTSYSVACRDPKDENKLYEIGKVSSGLKEETNDKNELSYQEMTEILDELIDRKIPPKDKTYVIKPKIVITVAYEEIQKSTNYSSGYALRFPRIIGIRQDLDVNEADDLEKIKQYYDSQ